MDAENIIPEAVGAAIELVRKRHSGEPSSRRVYLDFNPIVGRAVNTPGISREREHALMKKSYDRIRWK